MKTTKEQHDARNELTAPEVYKRYNVAIIDAYNALHPLTFSKLSMVVFNVIMESKLHRQPGARDFNSNEDKRIYNNKHVTLEGLLDRCHPVKYGLEGKPMKTDLSNLMGRLQELEDNNIFYMWKYGKPFSYMFIMERDIGAWRYFNPTACVPPKTLSKIIVGFNGMVDTMARFEKNISRPLKLKSIEASFINELIPHIVSKMDKKVADKLPVFDEEQTVAAYLTDLRGTLEQFGEYDGLEERSDFLKRLPRHLAEKIEDKLKKAKGKKKMNVAQLSRDLVPSDENLVKEPKTSKKTAKPTSTKSLNPEKTTFKSLDPFSNCNHLMKYYREVIRLYNNNAKFYPTDAERTPATQIMDLLIQHGKEGDTDFLRSWIRYYIGSYLQGGNVYKPEKTSLSNFKKTFKAYEGKYFRA